MNLDWFVTLSVIISTVIIATLGSLINVTVETILWFIFGAVMSIGLAALEVRQSG